jgi:prepilin-type N-terminal cleavage/methylation domain-containing protein
MNNKYSTCRQTGFTLIELLVAMGIVAVLTGMAAFNFNLSRIRARDIQRKNDLSQLQKAMELYKNDNGGNYPEKTGFQDTLKVAGYTKVTFNDPRDEWATYYYSPDSDVSSPTYMKAYYLMACLENVNDNTKSTGTGDDGICYKWFPIYSGAKNCTCGQTAADSNGVMYTLSNP